MELDLDQFDTDAANVTEEMPAYLAFDGTTIQCMTGESMRAKSVVDDTVAMFQTDFELEVVYRLSQLSQINEQEKVQVKMTGETGYTWYRVRGSYKVADGKLCRLTLDRVTS